MKKGNTCFTLTEHETNVWSILIHLWWVITAVMFLLLHMALRKMLTGFEHKNEWQNISPVFIISFSTQCQSENCAATCTKATKAAQNSADSNHKNQNYPNYCDLEIKEKIRSFFNK